MGAPPTISSFDVLMYRLNDCVFVKSCKLLEIKNQAKEATNILAVANVIGLSFLIMYSINPLIQLSVLGMQVVLLEFAEAVSRKI